MTQSIDNWHYSSSKDDVDDDKAFEEEIKKQRKLVDEAIALDKKKSENASAEAKAKADAKAEKEKKDQEEKEKKEQQAKEMKEKKAQQLKMQKIVSTISFYFFFFHRYLHDNV